MNKLFQITLAILAVTSCINHQLNKTKDQMEVTTIIPEKDKIYVTVLVYIKEGMQTTFAEYRAKTGAIFERYGARIEKVIKPTMMAKGEMELPSEILFAVFDSKESMEAVNNDTDYQKVIEELRTPSVDKLIVIPSQLSDFEFEREVGDKHKTYGIALLNYNKGELYKAQFEKYHNQACEIMPEFGTHFERFLIPTKVNGDFDKPDEIHRFYFDAMDGLQRMGSDERMQALFPLRDQSLRTLNFIIGEAL